MSRLLSKVQLVVSKVKESFEALETASQLQPGTPCCYSQESTLPFSQNASGLASWLSTPHDKYNMASLDFYGHLIDDTGETIGFSSMIQQQFDLPDTKPYLAEFSICNGETDGVVVAPFMIEKDKVTFDPNSFSETATVNLLIEDEKITMELVTGTMGQAGATYKLTGKAFAFDAANWVYEIELTDTMGAIGVGYGPSSFLPQWLTPQQYQSITKDHKGSVQDYLKKGTDDMSGAGSYYFSLPMLQVNSFTITVDGLPFAKGSQGYLWVDHVTQSFSEVSYPILKNKATWQFLAIQFPPAINENQFSGALMFSKVEMPVPGSSSTPPETSTLPMARFWHTATSDKRNLNGALEAWHEWAVQDIQFKTSDLWPVGAEHQFPLQFTLKLGDPKDKKNYAVLQGKSVRENQEIKLVQKYEGLYQITGSIYVKDIHMDTVWGYAWGEIH